MELRHVCRAFASTLAVNDISLTLQRGEILGIIGRSGAGKSTLIRCLNGLETIDSGEIFFNGTATSKLGREGWRTIQHKIGMIFQHFNLLSSRQIIDNVALPLKLLGETKAKRHARALELLDLVGLTDKAHHYPAALSGGQKQRVGIARALAAAPSVLLSDEATSALDPETTNGILELLHNINKQMQLTIIMITHEMEVIRQIANRVLVLDQGRIAEEGAVKDIFANPQSQTTKALLATITPQLPATLADKLQSTKTSSTQHALVELRLVGEKAQAPFFNQLTENTGMVARLVQGGIATVQGEAIGHFFLSLTTSDEEKLKRALVWLAAYSDKSEVLGFVEN